MPKKKQVRTANPFETYDFDFEEKVAFMFPSSWSEGEKRQFRGLSSKVKKEKTTGGGGIFIYNGEDLRIRSIPSDLLLKLQKPSSEADSKPQDT